MKLLSLLLTSILCATASAQTIKTLGYNTTNGQVVANTGTNVLTFTNAVNLNAGISENGILIWDSQNNEFYAGATFHGEVAFGGSNAAIHAATTRANLGFSTNLNTLWTATNYAGLYEGMDLNAAVTEVVTNSGNVADYIATLFVAKAGQLHEPLNDASALYQNKDLSTNNSGWFVADITGFRSAIGLPLASLTNTSNVTMMRALSGSTNTNHPYSGSISVTGTNNTNTLVFSNGILQSVQ